MNHLLKMQELAGTFNLATWLIANVIFSMVFSYLEIYLFKKFFRIQLSKIQIVKLTLLIGSLKFISSSLFKFPYSKIINIVISIFILKWQSKQSIEKCVLGVIGNTIIVSCLEIIFAKFYCNIMNFETFMLGIYDLQFFVCFMGSIAIFNSIICFIINKSNLVIDFGDELSPNNKMTAIITSIIGLIVVLINEIEVLVFITNFPYTILILDVVALSTYFYMSIENVIMVGKYEKQDIELHNLEQYNKTLSIMYDSLRGFKHDFSNFVQALNGYVKVNDIEGIKAMTCAIYTDCKGVTNMGVLDPKIINNPAIYSILANKYYIAQSEDITMNIEVMLDLKAVKVGMYELCKILGVLLDNAIEAARECEEKVINVKFTNDLKTNKKILIIENTYNSQNIDINKIFEKGNTSKKDSNKEHGLGLWNVKKLINHCRNLNLITTGGKMFCQRLEISET